MNAKISELGQPLLFFSDFPTVFKRLTGTQSSMNLFGGKKERKINIYIVNIY